MFSLPQLPICELLPELSKALNTTPSGGIIITAPPGSGKTTVVPLALLSEQYLSNKQILLLEPRRMAARLAARRMASTIGEEVGGTVGYQLRMERRSSKQTRVMVLTEGVLSRMLIDDPELENVGAIIFDEFHERSIHADFGLALALEVQRSIRPDLRIIIMSATLDAAPIAKHLGDGTPCLEANGTLFPVNTKYLPMPRELRLSEAAAKGIRTAAVEQEGSILAFLPGEGEIKATAELLSEFCKERSIELAPLYAALSLQEQERAIAPAIAGQRKIVLATSIAESSLTIQGITTVVDTGKARVPRYSNATGMMRLETVRISMDRADQRRGRAGRLCEGVCYRLWDAREDALMPRTAVPELCSSELSTLVLMCADFGSAERCSLPWLTLPPETAWQQGIELLQRLEALTPNGAITPQGRKLLQFGTHPRLAHAMLSTAAIGNEAALAEACMACAALSEGVNVRSASTMSELLLELESMGASNPRKKAVHELAAMWQRRAIELVRDLDPATETLSLGLIMAFAYPDRIARRRKHAEERNRYLLASGRGVRLVGASSISSDWIVAIEVDDKSADGAVQLAEPLTIAEIEKYFSNQFREEACVEWSSREERVIAQERVMLGAITIKERPIANPDEEQICHGICEGIRSTGLHALDWTTAAMQLRERIAFLHRKGIEGFPDVSDKSLLATLEAWLGPYLFGVRKLSALKDVDLCVVFQGMLGANILELDRMAPSHIRVPSGSRIRIDYSEEIPCLAVRLQEVFGMLETPKICGEPILMKLLSPAMRPVQLTQDLQSFWKNGYPLVRKDLRGRYPKHKWPENPI